MLSVELYNVPQQITTCSIHIIFSFALLPKLITSLHQHSDKEITSFNQQVFEIVYGVPPTYMYHDILMNLGIHAFGVLGNIKHWTLYDLVKVYDVLQKLTVTENSRLWE